MPMHDTCFVVGHVPLGVDRAGTPCDAGRIRHLRLMDALLAYYKAKAGYGDDPQR